MKNILIAAAILILCVVTPLGGYVTGVFRPVEVVSVTEAASAMAADDGRPALIILYHPRCSISRRLFPDFVQLGERARQAGADVLAYGTGGGLDALLVGGFMNEYRAPFPARRIRPWQPGDLISALAEIGVTIESAWVRPLVLVRNRHGQIVYQDQGVSDIRPAAEALAAQLSN